MRSLLLLFAWVAFASEQTNPPPDNDPPITAARRAEWVVQGTAGPTAIVSTAIGAAWDTWLDHPKEYNPHWSGFGQRNALRATTTATRGIIEAGLSQIWDEDPRYHRAPNRPFGGRLANILKMTVMAVDSDGRSMPAYSRFVAIPASSFISDAWRPPSDRGIGVSLSRIGTGFLGRMAGNAWGEFWPDVRARIFRKKH